MARPIELTTVKVVKIYQLVYLYIGKLPHLCKKRRTDVQL